MISWYKKYKEKKANIFKEKYESAKCGDKIKPHKFKESYTTEYIGTGDYLNEVEITRKKIFRIRICNQCSECQVWNDWDGWN